MKKGSKYDSVSTFGLPTDGYRDSRPGLGEASDEDRVA